MFNIRHGYRKWQSPEQKVVFCRQGKCACRNVTSLQNVYLARACIHAWPTLLPTRLEHSFCVCRPDQGNGRGAAQHEGRGQAAYHHAAGAGIHHSRFRALPCRSKKKGCSCQGEYRLATSRRPRGSALFNIVSSVAYTIV